MYIHYLQIMNTTVQMWGNSLAVRLPKKMAQAQRIEAGTPVVITPQEDGFTITPILIAEEEITLEELLSQITTENIHDEVFTGELSSESW